MPRRRAAGSAALLLLAAGAYVAGGGTGHATDGPGPVIGKVTFSPGATTTRAEELYPVPTVRFTVTVPDTSVSIANVAMHFQRVSSSVSVLDQGDQDCKNGLTCTRSGNVIKVSYKLFVQCSDASAIGRKPGEYRPVMTVTTSDAKATLVRPKVGIVIKRRTEVKISVSPKQARKGETLRFSSRMFRYTVLTGRCNYANFAWKGQPLQLWFDPKGSAGAKKIATAKTGSDEFARFKPRNPGAGVWTVRYAGDSQHATSVSAKRVITQLR